VLCPDCKTEDTSAATATLKEQVGIPPMVKVYRAVGCPSCRNTGYHGRHAIFEWMDLTNEIRQMVLKNASSGEIRDVAVRNGMHSLSDDGWRLIGMGVTTPEEVMRVAKDQTFGNGKHGGLAQNGTAFILQKDVKAA
jgi:type II secretory ATPase GspE/PulE/Tfp pilus assembly ATPase PilB-like protein